MPKNKQSLLSNSKQSLLSNSKKKTVQTKKKQPSKRNDLFIPLVTLALLVFVGVGYFLYSPKPAKQEVLAQAVVQEKPKPVLSGITQAPIFTARGIYAFDVDSGEVLYSKNAEDPLLPASTTKIATALVAMKVYKPDETLKAIRVGAVAGQKMGLYEGELITAESLIKATLIHSANDAAMTLANNYPGGYPEFIKAMNQLASDWGLSKTHFTNPVGFDEYLHFSTPRDLAMLARLAMEEPVFAEIVGLQNAVVASIDGRNIHHLATTNQLLGHVPGVVGVKTGHTITSGESLVTQIDRDGHKVILALVGSLDRFGESKVLIDWVFANYTWPKGFSQTSQ